MELYIIILLIVAHFCGDFLIQAIFNDNLFKADSYMKYDDIYRHYEYRFEDFFIHCLYYTIPFLFFINLYFILSVFMLHFVVDIVGFMLFNIIRVKDIYIKRFNKLIYIGLGLDQAIHILCLLFSYKFFMS